MAFICNLGWHTKVSVFVLLMTRMNNTNPNKKLGWSQFPCYTGNTRRSTLVKHIICLQLDTDYMANIHWIVFFNDNLLNYLGCIAPKHLQIIRLLNISTCSVPDEGYSMNALCALYLISTFLSNYINACFKVRRKVRYCPYVLFRIVLADEWFVLFWLVILWINTI